MQVWAPVSRVAYFSLFSFLSFLNLMKTSTLNLWAVALLCLFLTACGPSIYLANDFRAYAPKHKVVAILPASVTMEMRPN